MILSKRLQPSASQTHISYPLNSELAPCRSSSELLASTPTTPPRGHKHSFSKPMTWLTHGPSSTCSHSANAAHAASKPTRISEPKISSSLEHLTFRRSGPLGSGATIVRTPQEALFGPTPDFDETGEEIGVKEDTSLHGTEKNESRVLRPLPSSPPLPPLPDIPDTEDVGRLSRSPASVCLPDHVPPPRSCGSPSPCGRFSSPRPTLQAHSRTASRLTPTLPADTHSTLPLPPFEAILLSAIPVGAIDRSRFIVTLETCVTTYRTSLRSLTSRPSHLSRYITSLLSPASETASIHSNTSETLSAQNGNSFSSFFRDHLASSGSLPLFASIHIFLDRPSGPYTHILAYLRSAPSTPEHPETLPRAVRFGSMSPSRLELLLDLRDEASYLGLVELEVLCCQGIQRFQRAPLLTYSNGSPPRGQTGSVHSAHTVVERCQPHQDVRPSENRVVKDNSGTHHAVKSAGRESSSGSSLENKDKGAAVWERGTQRRSIRYEVGSPPPGWI